MIKGKDISDDELHEIRKKIEKLFISESVSMKDAVIVLESIKLNLMYFLEWDNLKYTDEVKSEK